MYADRDGRADARTDRKTDMINHQKPAYENGKLRTFYTAGLLLDIKKKTSALVVGWLIMQLFSVKYFCQFQQYLQILYHISK